MPRVPRSVACLAVGLTCLLTGCTDQISQPTSRLRQGTTDLASTILPETELAQAEPAAFLAFKQYYRVDPSLSATGLLVSRPEEVETSQPERVRDFLAPNRNRHRQIAELRLLRQGRNVVVQCRVETQRLDTTEQAAFQAVRSGDDRPNDTPIDREGAAGTSTRQEWVVVGRDRTREREILDLIEELVAPAPSPITAPE